MARRTRSVRLFQPRLASGFFVSARRGAFPRNHFLPITMFKRLFLHFTAVIALPLAVSAAKESASITLAEALARTLRSNPELAVYDWEIRMAEARVLQAGVRPNPELSIDIENPT